MTYHGITYDNEYCNKNDCACSGEENCLEKEFGKKENERIIKKILNFTPHMIFIYNEDNELIHTIPSSGVARITSEEWVVTKVKGIPIMETCFGEVEGLPEEAEDTILIVSRLVLHALPDRNDLVTPCLRVCDETGEVIGYRSLARS